MQATSFNSFKETASASGSVRVDLVGGTLDLEPINLILPDVVTMNVATSLKANVTLNKTNIEEVIIISKDYDKSYSFNKSEFTKENLFHSSHFKEMGFICQILNLFNITSNITIELSSGAPAGSGLGGSSAMGVTLYKALCDFTNTKLDIDEAVLKVKGCESRILNQGVPGYQDYFPALCGGVLALRGEPGKIKREQLYSEELKDFLEKRVTLVFSGIQRDSGINNWDVYKGFFDKDKNIRSCMENIARVSSDAYQSIKSNDFEGLLNNISLEGENREALAKGITPNEIKDIFNTIKSVCPELGIKMCGAGGGGCFILISSQENQNRVKEMVLANKMQVLDFFIEAAL
jgi:D-glycero-alpha-D-manno-heptose-7-phosphate kinase